MTAPVIPASGAAVPQMGPGAGAAKGAKGEAAQTDASFASLLAAFALTGQVNPALLNGAAPHRAGEAAGGTPVQAVPGLPLGEGGGLPFGAGVVNPFAQAGAADAANLAAGQGAPLPVPGEAAAGQTFAEALGLNQLNQETQGGVQAQPAPNGPEVLVEVVEASGPQPAVQPAAQDGQAAPGALAMAGQGGAEADAEPQPVVSAEAPAPSVQVADGVEATAGGAGSGGGEGLLNQGGGAEGGALGQDALAEGGPQAESGALTEGMGRADGSAPSGAAEPVVAAPAGTASSSGAGTAEGAQPSGLDRLTGRLQPQQLMEELARALPEVEEGQYRLTLKLHPEHLGEVRLQLQMSGREVYAAMEVANADARQALENRGEQLRQGLSQAGFDLSGFEVSTGQRRQPQRDRGEAFGDLQPGAGRQGARTEQHTAAAISRIRSAGSLTGRLDTKA